jgi:hypothetical protein
MRPSLLIIIYWLYGTPAFSQDKIQCQPSQNQVEVQPEMNSIAQSMCLFSNPLIVGASVSAGYMANPGGAPDIIAKKLNPGAQVSSMAHPDKTSIQSLTMGKNKVPYDQNPETPSIVMGLDLFYWDAYKEKCGPEFEKHTTNFFSFYQEKKVPMIIGRLPVGLNEPSGYAALNKRECTKKINQLLEKLCTLEKNCTLYNPADCLSNLKLEAKEKFGAGQELQRIEYLKKKQSEFFVDDKHPSDAGNQYCANSFIKSKVYQGLTCK